jgi:tetratricopeptide (TPR) repeat protein/tRNA A-37 threonylcarbamoyl transferase component Bud32
VSRPPQAVPTLAAGDLLAGRFRVVAFLGAGAVGEVYAAEDEALGGRVAVKGLRPEIAADAAAIERLQRELHLTRAVTHRNVCRTYDGFVDAGGRLFLTMELLPGEPLDTHLARRGRLPAAEAEEVLRQIAEGLAAAHAAGVVHRDLKTGNVFLVDDGERDDGNGVRRVVVADFGLARSLLAGGGSATRTGEVMGSPAYMAPEQVRGEPVTAATDVYALGVIAYELVTGELPFQGETGFVTALKRLTDPPPPPRRLAPELPAVWDEAVLRCLAADPGDRFADPRQLPRALAEAGEAGGAGEGARVGGEGIAPRADGWWRRRPRRMGRRAALAAAGAVLLAALAWSWGREGGDAEPPAAEPPAAEPLAPSRSTTAATPLPSPPADTAAAERATSAGDESFDAGRPAEARAAYLEALALWRAADDAERQAAALTGVANTLASEGRLDEATEPYRQALELRRRLGDEPLLARAHESLARHHFRLGDLDGARRELEASLVLARRGGRPTDAARALVQLAAVLRQAGDAAQGERALRAAVAAYLEADEPARADAVRVSLANVLRHGGRLREAVDLLERPLARFEGSGSRQEASVRTAYAETLHALGRAGADEHLARAGELWRQMGSRAAAARSAMRAAAWRVEAGDAAGARVLLLPALAELEEIGGHEGFVEALRILSDLHRLEDDLAAARDAAERALARARELEMPEAVAQSLLRLGRLALDEGLPAEAVALAGSAAADLERHGSADDARLARLLAVEAYLDSGALTAARAALAASDVAASESALVGRRRAAVAERLAAADAVLAAR